MAAFAAGGDGACTHPRAELHHSHEAVAAGTVVLLRAGPAVCAERGQRAPARGDERHRDAGLRIVEVRLDRVVQALEAVDLAPGHAPAAEILLQAVHRFVHRMYAVPAAT